MFFFTDVHRMHKAFDSKIGKLTSKHDRIDQ